MMRVWKFSGLSLLLLPLLAGSAGAQAFTPLNVPDASPAASVRQVLGVTEMEITYSRPAVNGRKIWGGLVPYGEVWRAGANENTTVSFSTPVTIEGTPLSAGTYGLHMIPTESTWTIIFSRQARAWGSFSYDPGEDAARVTVTPVPREFQERLSYSFDEPTTDRVTISLNWEKLRVPFVVGIDLAGTVTAGLQEQMRGLPRFFWQGWQQAAGWLYANGGDLALAGDWADRSLRINRTGGTLLLKANILERQGDAAGAATLRSEAMSVATEAEINNYGYQLLGQGKKDEALAIFQRNAKSHPDSWNAHDSLAEGYAGAGRTKEALASYRKALSLATDPDQKKRIEGEIRKLSS